MIWVIRTVLIVLLLLVLAYAFQREIGPLGDFLPQIGWAQKLAESVWLLVTLAGITIASLVKKVPNAVFERLQKLLSGIDRKAIDEATESELRSIKQTMRPL